jgi:hypothetical protein
MQKGLDFKYFSDSIKEADKERIKAVIRAPSYNDDNQTYRSGFNRERNPSLINSLLHHGIKKVLQK